MNMENMKEIFADEAFVKSLFELVSGGSVLGTIGLALIGAACVAAFAIATDDLIYECTGRHW